jgi:hypothetical protein
MKKLAAFALVLSLGVFCAVGCTPATPPKKIEPPKTNTPVKKDVETPKADPKADPKVETPKTETPKTETEKK